MKLIRTSLILALVFAATALNAASAHAAAIYKYGVNLDSAGVYSATPSGSLAINSLDASKTTAVTVTPPSGPNLYSGTQSAGPTSFVVSAINGLAPGDSIAVRQPSGSVTPTETYVVPAFTIDVVTGATVLTGNIPAGWIGAIETDYRCESNSIARTLGAGAFSMPNPKILPGEVISMLAYDAAGDSMFINSSSPGETPCISLSSSGQTAPPPGSPPDPTPFHITVNHLLMKIAPSVRVVLRRGSNVLFDDSVDATSDSKDISAQPLPGDVVDVYRPKTAAAPTTSMTIPPISAAFDPAAGLVAINSPAAGMILASSCHAYGCSHDNYRVQRNVPAGRNFLDFSKPQTLYPSTQLRPDDYIFTDWVNTDYTLEYDLRAAPADLVPPSASFKLPSKLKVSALLKLLKKGYKLKLHSNEAGTAKLTFAMGKAKLATANGKLSAGSNTFKLKFTKSGKKAIRKLAAKGKRAKTQSATLAATLTDGSGNVSTLAKTAKLKP